MDEQRLAARIRALDAAAHIATGGGRSLVNNPEFVTDLAERFEEWIMRPEPPAADPHQAETVADRLGYQRCPTTWRERPDGPGHACMHPPEHDGLQHTCSCGALFTLMANAQPRQPCGAFERPPWFTGDPAAWATCSGEHASAPGEIWHGWHISTENTEPGEAPLRFATHHAVAQGAPGYYCACGAPWPCDRID